MADDQIPDTGSSLASGPANPAPAPAAPAIPAAPAPLSAGLSALASNPPTQLGSSEYQQAQGFESQSQSDYQRARALANAPVIPPDAPHAKLLGMVSAIATGLSAFGTAMGTGGKEGGAKEVAEIQGEQQRQKLESQQFAINQRNQQIQQQITLGDTAHKMGQNIILMAQLPLQLQEEDLHVKQGQQALESGQVEMTKQKADFASQYGVSPKVWDAITSGKTDGVTSQDTDNFSAFNRRVIQSRASTMPNDPTAQQALKVANDPNASPDELINANASVNQQYNLNQQNLKTQQEQTALLPKNEQEAAAQLASAKTSGDAGRIAAAQSTYDSVHKVVEDEKNFASNLQRQNSEATKDLAFAQKGTEDINKLWTDPQHGFSQTLAQVNATKSVIQQAKDGSQLAASLEPAMAVLGVNSFAGVHRISPTEYEAAGPAVGSLYRRLNAALDKAGSGSVPPETLAEVSTIMDALTQAKYQSSLASTRQIVANSNIPANKISVPDPNNFGALTPLDKVGATASPASGKGVSLAAARQLPAMKGKTDAEIKAAIEAQGHSVLP